MAQIYILYLIGCVISLLMCKQGRLAAKVGFGITAVASAYGIFYFLVHLGDTISIALWSNLLYEPKLTLHPLGNFFSFVISLVSLASSIYAISYCVEYEKRGNLGVMAALFNVFIVSMLLVLSSSDVFWFMIFWESMTVASAFLIAFNDSKASLKAIMLYLGIAELGAMCIVAAFLILAQASGSIEFSSFESIQLSPTLASLAFILAFIGFGSKAGMFPFHVWLPKAHPAAPTNVSALMSGVMIKVAIFAIIKFSLWLPLMPWWGLLIVIIGALSSLLGVLYALAQHDYKSLLAYHSVENIGIILLGLGSGFYGLAIHSPLLASVGFLAGLYHILNHATFKGLLFLSAGSVLFRTHTKDIESLGGLAKKMPLTAFSFLIGSLAITALPPLNGFVSEWFTYQSMLQGALGNGIASRFVFTLSILALALTGALAIMCFVKVYTVIFGGTPRDLKIFEKAKESPLTMIIGMFLLVIGCVVFGIGANFVTSKLLIVVVSFTNGFFQVSQEGVYIASPIGSIISLPIITLILAIAMILPFIIVAIFNKNTSKPIETDPWACGFKYSSKMQMTAGPFTGDLRRLLSWLYKSNSKVENQGYFKPVIYNNHPQDIWWNIFYQPVLKSVAFITDKIGAMQNGSTSMYCAYTLMTLCIFIGISKMI
jgi:hydrogenase-4 component B